MLLQKSYQTDSLPYQSKINRGKLEKFYIQGTHEAIIDPIQFRLANILLKLRTPSHNGLATGEYLLTRKIRCGECGTAYRRKVARGKHRLNIDSTVAELLRGLCYSVARKEVPYAASNI